MPLHRLIRARASDIRRGLVNVLTAVTTYKSRGGGGTREQKISLAFSALIRQLVRGGSTASANAIYMRSDHPYISAKKNIRLDVRFNHSFRDIKPASDKISLCDSIAKSILIHGLAYRFCWFPLIPSCYRLRVHSRAIPWYHPWTLRSAHAAPISRYISFVVDRTDRPISSEYARIPSTSRHARYVT